jgi:hypothetical protein
MARKGNLKIPLRDLRRGMLFMVKKGRHNDVLGYTLSNWRKARKGAARHQAWEGRVIETLVLRYGDLVNVPFVTELWIKPEQADDKVTILMKRGDHRK